ncbi:hydroxyacid dehydrogenase [Hoeflea prorocentri]|uniref:Hydroxyacid dehydrogenase n=1 Tax=Hoeflea prorocentri TaxID=1922333 RepID=A0A9X3UMS0_9HYPH|nr:hydroxyacid dehydrogenase [Hoeflea prorocentri]MCY6383573.1 hydroxyacid dehydrogenase [Hoeflea prorocentri]MDA5401373.1 hydroxyacid dehydrogenase [Hoeflea prorocentri]
MAKIVITEFMDDAAVALLSDHHETHYDRGLADRQEDIPSLTGDASALIVRNRTQVNTALLDATPGLKCVGRLGVGLDNIDLEACKARGVAVFPATGANNQSVAEYVIANAMLLLRGAYHSSDAMLSGAWPRQQLMGRELAGRTMGLVGFGAIAREVALRASVLGMDIVAYDPFCMADDPGWQLARNVSLDGLLELSDVVSLHTPLNDKTRHMINADALSKMKPDAVIINAARGGVVDEDALAAALSGGRLAGAALDVFEVEPLTAEAAKKFAGIGNVVLTPHIAGVTDESNVRVSAMTAKSVLDHLAGAGHG